MAREIILTAYLITDKDGQRAELAEIRGFIHAGSTFRAFADVEIQARGTSCVKPFFHCYVRLPEDERLSHGQCGFIARCGAKKN
jgi:hypothetical protein